MDALCGIAARDERVVLLTCDLGYMVMEPFREQFPARFHNVGVAEQNMIGLATGLAEAGFLPFAYSIATFASLRAFEFIRNGPVLHRLPVRVIGMGMGFEYGHSGSTHHAVEDIGALRTLPALTIVAPADSGQAGAALRATWDLPGPVYYSLGKDDRSYVPNLDGRFELGRVQVVRPGRGLAIVTLGSISSEACAAAEILAAQGVPVKIVIVSNFQPDPVTDIVHELRDCEHVVSVEAQTISGGLGAFLGMVISTHRLGCRLWAMAVRGSPDGTSGSQQDRWRKHGLDRASIVSTCLTAIGTTPVQVKSSL